MLCAACQTITPVLLASEKLFKLHTCWEEVGRSADEGCCICVVLFNDEALKERREAFVDTGFERDGVWAQGSTGPSFGKARSRSAVIVGYVDDLGTLEEVASYEVFVYQEDTETPKRKRITGRPISSFADEVRCFELARKWISECLKYHVACPSKGCAVFPTRVLDLALPGDGSDDLCLGVPGNEKGAWVVLSHCWGPSAENRYTTTASNLKERMRGIRFKDLPQTFQDAVIVSRTLGYRYLWIDSLCILQDGHTDWVAESSRMRDYYANAILSIAADEAEGDEVGFLRQPRPNSQITSKINDEKHQCETHINIRHPLPIADLSNDTALSKRAWTLQEDILASRTLHYTSSQLIWECQACKYSESDVSELGNEDGYIMSNIKRLFFAPELGTKYGYYERMFDPMSRWTKIIGSYVKRNITFHSDRLPAISAVAREIGARSKNVKGRSGTIESRSDNGNRYAAGIWVRDFTRQICWSSWGNAEPTGEYVAPSWSWASLRFASESLPGPGGVSGLFPLGWLKDEYLLDRRQAELLDFYVDATDGDAFGRIKFGRLRIRGMSLEASAMARRLVPVFQSSERELARRKTHVVV